MQKRYAPAEDALAVGLSVSVCWATTSFAETTPPVIGSMALRDGRGQFAVGTAGRVAFMDYSPAGDANVRIWDYRRDTVHDIAHVPAFTLSNLGPTGFEMVGVDDSDHVYGNIQYSRVDHHEWLPVRSDGGQLVPIGPSGARISAVGADGSYVIESQFGTFRPALHTQTEVVQLAPQGWGATGVKQISPSGDVLFNAYRRVPGQLEPEHGFFVRRAATGGYERVVVPDAHIFDARLNENGSIDGIASEDYRYGPFTSFRIHPSGDRETKQLGFAGRGLGVADGVGAALSGDYIDLEAAPRAPGTYDATRGMFHWTFEDGIRFIEGLGTLKPHNDYYVSTLPKLAEPGVWVGQAGGSDFGFSFEMRLLYARAIELNPATVPEPTTLLAGATATGLLLARARRRKH